MNPEFRRNIWLEITPHRLVGMPLVLTAIFLLIYMLNGYKFDNDLAVSSLFGFTILSVLWGTRLSSESVITEIRDRTWDSQRMSAIGPWQMTWGKLLGSPIYTWYGGAICLLLYAFASENDSISLTTKIIILFVFSGMFSQSIALLSSLQALKKERKYNRSQAAAYLVLGVIVVGPILGVALQENQTFKWYGKEIVNIDFVLGTLCIFLCWSVFGIYRLMRTELQLKSSVWVWLIFVIFVAFYFAGFAGYKGMPRGNILSERLFLANNIFIVFTYFMLFAESKDPVFLRRLINIFQKKRWKRLLENIPSWMSTVPLVVFTTLLLLAYDHESIEPQFNTTYFNLFLISLSLLLLRDIGLLLYLNLGKNRKRADMATLLYLGLLYGIIPTILANLELEFMTALLWPRWDNMAVYGVCAIGLEVLLMYGLIVRRWKTNYVIGVARQ